MIRVVIADDQRLMREGMKTILSLEEELEVVGVASNGAEALECTLQTRPDVVLMDIRMPEMDGVVGTRMIKEQLPDTKVLILTTFNDSELIFEALEEGASGYLLKDMPAETIVQAILTVHTGGVVLPPESTAQIVAELKKMRKWEADRPAPDGHVQAKIGLEADSSSRAPVEELTQRELEVLQLLGHGLSNKEIAERLVITEGTVKNHVSNSIAKLHLRDRTQAAIYAVRHGITKFEP
jgi:DNA-binding NarL/FixJ family response regulator